MTEQGAASPEDVDLDEPNEDYHLSQIEYHTAKLRGMEHDRIHPSQFRLPTCRELREMRERCALSREQAADEIGYSVSTFQNVETGNAAPGREFIRRALLLYRREWPRGDSQ